MPQGLRRSADEAFSRRGISEGLGRLAGFDQLGIAAVFAGHFQKPGTDFGIGYLAGETFGLIGLKSIMLRLGHESTFEFESNPRRKGSLTPKSRFRALPFQVA
jgi:hypothetical protein